MAPVPEPVRARCARSCGSRLVAATGEFDTTLRAAEDWDYWIRAAQRGRFSYLPGAVGVYRVHPGQMHNDLELMRSNGRRVADKNFPRGSRDWRILMASWTWAEGAPRRRPAATRALPVTIVQTAWIARSPRILRDVLRWA